MEGCLKFVFFIGLKIDYFVNYSINEDVLKGLNGIKLTYNNIDQRTLINILQYYFLNTDFFAIVFFYWLICLYYRSKNFH